MIVKKKGCPKCGQPFFVLPSFNSSGAMTIRFGLTDLLVPALVTSPAASLLSLLLRNKLTTQYWPQTLLLPSFDSSGAKTIRFGLTDLLVPALLYLPEREPDLL